MIGWQLNYLKGKQHRLLRSTPTIECHVVDLVNIMLIFIVLQVPMEAVSFIILCSTKLISQTLIGSGHRTLGPRGIRLFLYAEGFLIGDAWYGEVYNCKG